MPTKKKLSVLLRGFALFLVAAFSALLLPSTTSAWFTDTRATMPFHASMIWTVDPIDQVIRMQYVDRKATSNIVYETIGWTITRTVPGTDPVQTTDEYETDFYITIPYDEINRITTDNGYGELLVQFELSFDELKLLIGRRSGEWLQEVEHPDGPV